MKKVFVLICLVLTAFHISAQNRRTFIILQDNSGSYYNSSQSDIQHIQNSLKKLFNNEQILDEYSLISSELKQGIPFYDNDLDKVHFLWFVADQAGNVNYFHNSDSSYRKFEDYFFSKAIEQNNQETINSYFNRIFSNRPSLKSAYNEYGISTYSFTSFAYPLCLDILPTDYSKEYIVILISDFKAGSTFGNKQDEKIFRDAFRNKAQSVLKRVSYLNSQFVKIDLGDYYKDAGYNSIIGFYVFKIRPNAGAPNPENIDVRIDSDIHFEQEDFGGDSYRIEPTKVVFNHSENLSIDNVFLEFSLQNGKVIRREITPAMSENNGTFTFNSINDITLPDITSSFNGTIDLRYLFNTSFIVDEANQQSIKYTFETNRTIDNTNFTFQTKLSNMEISAIVATIILSLFAIVIVVLWRKGKPVGILTKFSRFNDSYESYDYSAEGLGKTHTDYKCWSISDQTKGGFEIKVYGRFDYQQHNKFYNWQENSGYLVRIYPSKLTCPAGFEAYISGAGRISNDANMPIEITDAFNDSKFEFSVIFRDKGAVINEPLPFSFEIELVSVNNGLRSFNVSTRISYQFHIGPDLGNVWLGLDPGTTGSCIAIATSSDDLTIEKNNNEDLISPSVILIPTDKLKTSSKEEIRNVARFGHKAQAVKNESDTMRKFVSIKKLLGYNTSYSLGTNKEGVELSVDSAFLSTLMVEKLLEQHQSFIESNKDDYPQFFENDAYNPKRAVIAIPNNFTASKIEHLRECVLDVKDSPIKELRFIYEAEAILVNYINSGNAKEKEQESERGETIFIFDMGGATINTTLANVKRRRRKNDLVWEIEIISKLGYGVGGDTIDYAYLQWIYSKSDEYSILAQNNPFGAHSSMDMKGRRKLKDAVLELKKQTIRNYESNEENLIDRYYIAQFNGYSLPMKDEGDVFVDDIKNGKNSFLYSKWFEEYVYDNVRSIVGDVLYVCKKKNINHLDTILMSGRSSHFPRIKETVESVVKSSGFEPDISLLPLTESKSAVAKGACYYGVLNSRIILQNITINGVFGVIQKTEPNKPPLFHKLIDDGDTFDNGFKTGMAYIRESQGFTFDGGVVRFCQVMGVNPTEIIAKNEKHKYSEVATIPAQPFPVQEVQISITDKDKILCSVTNTNGDTIPPVESIVKDSDIMACNDEQYTFFVKQL